MVDLAIRTDGRTEQVILENRDIRAMIDPDAR
jgi:hypothetical protein